MAGAFDAPAFRFHRAAQLGALRGRANAATEKSEYPMSEKFALCDFVQRLNLHLQRMTGMRAATAAS